MGKLRKEKEIKRAADKSQEVEPILSHTKRPQLGKIRKSHLGLIFCLFELGSGIIRRVSRPQRGLQAQGRDR